MFTNADQQSVKDWSELVAALKSYIAELFHCEPRDISLHHNTTAAFQRIVIRLRRHFDGISPVLLLTDQEYPGLVALLDEQWPGPMLMVRTAECVWNGRPSQQFERLDAAIRRYKPHVVVLSHVSRASGATLPDAWIDRFKSVCVPGALLVLDGAQAVGNIVVTPTAKAGADFYVFSGHKWLRGLTTLGIVVASQGLWHVDDPAQGYSSQVGSRGTGSGNVVSSLLQAFQEYPVAASKERAERTSEKAQLLATLLAEKQVVSIGLIVGRTEGESWAWNGIVSIPLQAHNQFKLPEEVEHERIRAEVFRNPEFGTATAGPRYLVEFDKRSGLPSNPLMCSSFCDVGVPLPPHGIARFCVTWDHEEAHLNALSEELKVMHE